jgi:myosin heavy subunit
VWVGKAKDDYQLGNSKVFMRNPVENTLEEHRQKKIVKFVIVLQRHFRGALARIHYRRMRKSIFLIQRRT